MHSFALAMAQRAAPPTAIHRINIATSPPEDVVDILCEGGVKAMYHSVTELMSTANSICDMVGRSSEAANALMVARIASIASILQIVYTDLSRVVPDELTESVRSARASVSYHETHEQGSAYVPVANTTYVYFHELLWMVIGRCLYVCQGCVAPTTTAPEFRELIDRTLTPDGFLSSICTTSQEGINALHARLYAYILELSTRRTFYVADTFTTLALAERVTFILSFFCRNTPISIPFDQPELTHPSGSWAPLPSIHPDRLKRVLNDYQLSSQDSELPKRLRLAVLASECFCGEYAEYARFSPHDALVHGPNTILPRGDRDPTYVAHLREIANFHSREAIPTEMKKYAGVIDVALYTSMFAERAPLVVSGAITRNAGRTGFEERVFEFTDVYYFPWYGWCSYHQHARFLGRIREGRKRLPVILQLHRNLYLVRDGGPISHIARRASRLGVNAIDGLVRLPEEPPPRWYYCASAAIALCVWEQLARAQFGGNMERPCALPSIASPAEDPLPAPLVRPRPLGDRE